MGNRRTEKAGPLNPPKGDLILKRPPKSPKGGLNIEEAP